MRTQICEFCSGVYTIEKEMLCAEKIYCPLCAHMNNVQKNRAHNSQSVHKAMLSIVLREEAEKNMSEEKKESSPPQVFEHNKVSFTKPVDKEKLLEELKKTFPTASFSISENGYSLSTWGRKIVEISGILPTEEQVLEVIKMHKPKFPEVQIREEPMGTQVDLETGKRKVSEGINDMVATLFGDKILVLKEAEEKNNAILAAVKSVQAAVDEALGVDAKKREKEKQEIKDTLAKNLNETKTMIAETIRPIETRVANLERNTQEAGAALFKIVGTVKKQ